MKGRRRFGGDWGTKRLGEIAAITMGQSPPSASYNVIGDGLPLIQGKADIIGRATIHRTWTSEPKKLCAAGDIVLTVRAPVGAVAMASKDSSLGRGVCGLKPLIDCQFLYCALILLESKWEDVGQGSTFSAADSSHVARFPIAIPRDSSEQRAIAAVLADVDALIGSLEALIAKKRAVKRGAMQQLLTGRTRLPGFGGEWKRVELGRIAEAYGGLAGKTKSDFENGTAPYVSFLDVLENVALNQRRFDRVRVSPAESQNRVRTGDVLFNATSETPEDLAMGSVVNVDASELYLNSFCFGVRIVDGGRCDPLFLAYFSRGEPGRTAMYGLAQGATRYNLSKRRFLALRLPLPPHPEQRAIAAVLSDMDAEIEALERRRDKTRALKQGMMQQLLTGSIRLPIPEAVGENDPSR